MLSKMARVVLAVPVSIVASELAFSTGRCILDPFRSSLSPLMIQNLVCAQNWLQAHVPISFCKSKDKMEALEDEFHDLANVFNFQTSCLLNVIKCVIYLSKILYIASIFSFLVLNQAITTTSSSSCLSKGGTCTTVSIDE